MLFIFILLFYYYFFFEGQFIADQNNQKQTMASTITQENIVDPRKEYTQTLTKPKEPKTIKTTMIQ